MRLACDDKLDVVMYKLDVVMCMIRASVLAICTVPGRSWWCL